MYENPVQGVIGSVNDISNNLLSVTKTPEIIIFSVIYTGEQLVDGVVNISNAQKIVNTTHIHEKYLKSKIWCYSSFKFI